MSYFNTIGKALSYIESKRSKRTLEDFKKTIKTNNISIDFTNIIHIAGTNGKGSTIQMIMELLKNHGYQVGTFTSPYMICHNDRMCINGVPISDQVLLQYINDLYELIEKDGLSMFEIDMLLMMRYFNEVNPDYCVIETGIGGLLDKTNIFNSKVSAITNIALDHQFMLGNTIEEIAYHKAGIIKENQICFTTEKQIEVLDVFNRETSIKNSKLQNVDINRQYDFLNVATYQQSNISLAIAIVESCINMNKEIVQNTINNFRLPGRFERIGKFYVDGGHNIAGIKALKESVEKLNNKSVVFIFSALADKDRSQMLDVLSAYPVIEVYFEDERSNNIGLYYKDAIEQVINEYDTIVLAGSMHFASIVRKYVNTI